MSGGWIKLHRELIKKPIWHQSTMEQKVILITLLLMASHRSNEWEWQCKKFTIKPGQFVTSLKSIQKLAGKGISIKNIRTAIHRFEKLGFLANQSTKQGRLITIINWDSYQDNKIEGGIDTGKEVAKGWHMSGNYQEGKERKEGKERNLYCAKANFSFSLFESFWNAFDDKRGKESTIRSWQKIPNLTDDLGHKIIEGAKQYALERKNILAKGGIPKMAQGWLTDRRWEDEIPIEKDWKEDVRAKLRKKEKELNDEI